MKDLQGADPGFLGTHCGQPARSFPAEPNAEFAPSPALHQDTLAFVEHEPVPSGSILRERLANTQPKRRRCHLHRPIMDGHLEAAAVVPAAYYRAAMRRSVTAAAISGAGVATILAQTPVLAAQPAGATGAHLLPTQLAFLANPTLAFGLLLVAMVGIGLELLHPGAIVPGTVGLLAGILAVAGLMDLPLNLLGLVLLAAAAALFVVDLGAASHGVLSLAGIGAAAAGGWLLFQDHGVDLVALIMLPLGLGAIWLWLSSRAMRVRRQPYGAVLQELLGLRGVVIRLHEGTAEARVAGEVWRVVARDGDPLEVGMEVEVLAQDGLTLIVRPTGLAKTSTSGAGAGEPSAPGGEI